MYMITFELRISREVYNLKQGFMVFFWKELIMAFAIPSPGTQGRREEATQSLN